MDRKKYELCPTYISFLSFLRRKHSWEDSYYIEENVIVSYWCGIYSIQSILKVHKSVLRGINR